MVRPITAPPPFWENFLPAPTHPAARFSFYTLLLFVRVFAGLVYGGPDCPARSFFLYGYQSRHPSLSGVTHSVLPFPASHFGSSLFAGFGRRLRRCVWLLCSTAVTKKPSAGKPGKFMTKPNSPETPQQHTARMKAGKRKTRRRLWLESYGHHATCRSFALRLFHQRPNQHSPRPAHKNSSHTYPFSVQAFGLACKKTVRRKTVDKINFGRIVGL